MIQQFKELDTEAKCLKCLSKEFNIVWCQGSDSSFYGSLCYKLSLKTEHLHVKCKRCGYEYLMRCADA